MDFKAYLYMVVRQIFLLGNESQLFSPKPFAGNILYEKFFHSFLFPSGLLATITSFS
jgi:hypothetical protein